MDVADARSPSQSRVREEYWDWLSVALYLLVPLDLLTTFGAAARFGTGAEANPLVAALLAGPLWVLVAVNLVVVVAATGGFAALLTQVRRTPSRLRPYFGVAVELWLGLLVAWGLFVFANNLAVVVHGASLL